MPCCLTGAFQAKEIKIGLTDQLIQRAAKLNPALGALTAL